MSNCNKYKNKLMLYSGNLLNDKDKLEIEKHLSDCPVCNERLSKLENSFEWPDLGKPSDIIKSVLEKGKEIKKKRIKINTLYNLLVFKNIILNLRKKAVVIPFFIILIFLGFIYYYFNFSIKNNLYVINAFGQVRINDEILDYKSPFSYSLKEDIKIDVTEGELLFQINNDMNLLIMENSNVIINNVSGIHIDFIKGTLYGNIKEIGEKEFLITSKDKTFQIVGTIFSINRNSDIIEFSVYDGIVKLISNKDEILIKENKKVVIYDNKIKSVDMSKEEKQKFDKIKNTVVFNNISDLKKIYIDIIPRQSDIYFNNDFVGKTPAYLLVNKLEINKLSVKKEGYKDLIFNNDNEYNGEIICLSKHEEKEEKIKDDINNKNILDLSNIKWIGLADEAGSTIQVKNKSKINNESYIFIDYDFGTGAWVQLKKSLNIDISNYDYISFDMININELQNKFVIGFIDDNGSFFINSIDIDRLSENWQRVVIPTNEFYYMGGGDTQLNQKSIKKIILSLEKIEGGKGRLGIKNINFTK